MSPRKALCVGMLCLSISVFPARAASLFSSDTFIGVTPFTGLTYGTSDELLSSMQSTALQSLFPAYVGNEQVSVLAFFRGLHMDISMGAGLSEVQLLIPSLGINQLFNTGGSRDANVLLLMDYIKSSGLLGHLTQLQAQTSPTDPIAGNPDSLMSSIIASEYEQVFLSDFSNIASPEAQAVSEAGKAALNQMGIGLEYGQMGHGSNKVESLTIPLSYSIRNDLDPRRQLLLRMPITIIDVDGAKGYHVGFGASYRYPMNARWSLVPSFNYAFTASTDLGSTAQLASLGLTSTYYWRMDGYDIGMGNMVGYVTTMPFSYQGYDFDPGIDNTYLRNGVVISVPTRIQGRKLHFETSLVDTRFFGSKLYDDNYQELRFTLGTTRSASTASSGLFRVGLSLRHTPNSNGYKIEFGYWF